MRRIFFIGCLLYVTCAFGQGQLVINNNAYLVMNGGVDLVIDNANANAISVAGTGGNIVSEAETNIVRWMVGTGTGNYFIPFTTASGVKIPVNLNISGAGTGTGKIDFSTYGNANWNNDTYRPTGVTNMTNMGTTNNSSEVIDRFWMIDAQGYVSKPSGTMQLNYDDAEHLAIGNTINEPDLKAERYDPAANNWETFPVGGTINTTSNYVSGIPFNASDFTRTWTLIDQTTHLLPITVISYTISCATNATILQWETASEIGTDYFKISGSVDGYQFNDIAIISAAGNSNDPETYEYSVDAGGFHYYKLSVQYTEGTEELIGIQASSCNSSSDEFHVYSPAPYTIEMQTLLPASTYRADIFTINGQLIGSQEIILDGNEATIQYTNQLLSAGMYVVSLVDLKHAGVRFGGKAAVMQ